MGEVFKSGLCQRCKATQQADLHLKVSCSGSEQFVWVCRVCKVLNPFGGDLFIKKERVYGYLTQAQIDSLPVLMPEAATRCVKCGERKAELHHWAPRAIFGDACEDWPKDYLCIKCHDEWHKQVTPNNS